MRRSANTGCTVLVVEGEPVQALDLERSLHDLGYAVLGPTGSWTEALDLLHRQRPDLALLDAQLSDDGLQPVAEALRLFDVPFAVMATGEEGPLDDPLLRMVPRLAKPYRMSELHRSVRALRLSDLRVQLASAEEHIATGRERLAGQLRLVERLAERGQGTGTAEVLLREMGRALRLMRQHRAYLRSQMLTVATEVRPR
jgi:CheY-like chemotaxis protein